MAENKRDRFGKFTTPKKIAFIKQALGGHRTNEQIDRAKILLEGREIRPELLHWISFELEDCRRRDHIEDGGVKIEESIVVTRSLIDENKAPSWRDIFLSCLKKRHNDCGSLIEHIREVLDFALKVNLASKLLPEDVVPLATYEGADIHPELVSKVIIFVYPPEQGSTHITADIAETGGLALPDWLEDFRNKIKRATFISSDDVLGYLRHFAESAALSRRAA